MNKERELLQKILTDNDDENYFISCKVYKEIEELLAQPEQEPVAWMYEWKESDGKCLTYFKLGEIPPSVCKYSMRNLRPLYASPPKREPLSTKQAEDLWETSNFKSAVPYYIFDEICVAVEQYHGIGVDDV